MNWATLLSPMTSPAADTVSGGKTAVDVATRGSMGARPSRSLDFEEILATVRRDHGTEVILSAPSCYSLS
jgi:hypothetical protein